LYFIKENESMLQKINNFLSQIFWKPVIEHPEMVKIHHQILKPFENSVPSFDDEDINVSFTDDNKKWYHNEFVYLLEKGTLIEPTNKICIKGFRTIIRESLSSDSLRPSLLKYIKFKLSFIKSVKVEKAVYFDGILGFNYFHFFSDIISKIWLLEKYDIDNNLPLIISKGIFEKTYFQYFYQNTPLKNRNWIVQDDNMWLNVSSLYIIKPFAYDAKYWKKTIDLVKPQHNNSSKKIFLTRSVSAGRYLRNMNELTEILKKYDFEIVDTEPMTFKSEMEIFSEAHLMVCIHGAGSTNLIFSDSRISKFIEILPSNNLCSHFYWLCKVMDINYNVIKAGPVDNTKSFTLDAKKLEEAIQNALKT